MTIEEPTPPENEPVDRLEFHTDMKVGDILRRTRVHYKQSLEQVEQVLRIRAPHLEALEKGEISKLPGRVYAIGFVRTYAEYLGLDGEKMVQLFKTQSVGRQAKPSLSFPVTASESKAPNLYIVLGALGGAVALIVLISSLWMGGGTDKQEIPPVPDTLSHSQLNQAPALTTSGQPAPGQQLQPGIPGIGANAPVVPEGQAAPSGQPQMLGAPQPSPVQQAGQGTAVPDPNAAYSPASQPGGARAASRVTLQITESTWVEIRNASGKILLRQVLKPGDVYMVPPEPGLMMTTGNAGGISVKVDGQPAPPLGVSAQVRRNIPLSPEALVQN